MKKKIKVTKKPKNIGWEIQIYLKWEQSFKKKTNKQTEEEKEEEEGGGEGEEEEKKLKKKCKILVWSISSREELPILFSLALQFQCLFFQSVLLLFSGIFLLLFRESE